MRCFQLIVINGLTIIRCLTEVCGAYHLQAIWIITRGLVAPSRDAIEFVLLSYMIYVQHHRNKKNIHSISMDSLGHSKEIIVKREDNKDKSYSINLGESVLIKQGVS
jgi:hypothetical protein